MSEQAEDPVERAFAVAHPRVRKLRLVMLALLVAILVARALGLVEVSWQLLLWLVAATAVLPPLLIAIAAGRNLQDPGRTGSTGSDD